MKKLTLLIACLGWVMAVSAQGTEFETGSFHAIHVSSSFEVYLQQADDYSVTAEAPKELMDDIHIDVKSGVLEVRMKDGYKKPKWWSQKDNDIVIHITFPSIDELNLSGAVELDAKNTLDLEDLVVNASGASEMHLHVRCDDLKIDLSGASDLSMDLYADNFSIETSGASHVHLTGETDDMMIECSGASHIKASELKADDVSIECSGASSIHVWAEDEISVEASGNSDIKYKCRDCDDARVHTTGASSVKKY